MNDVKVKDLSNNIESIFLGMKQKAKRSESSHSSISNSNNINESFFALNHKDSLSSLGTQDNQVITNLNDPLDQLLNSNSGLHSLKILFRVSAYDVKFLGYHYFFKTVFHSENLATFTRSGLTPLRTPNQTASRTNHIKELYQNQIYASTISLVAASPKIGPIRTENRDISLFNSGAKKLKGSEEFKNAKRLTFDKTSKFPS